jgi:hypothetical protein
MPDGKSLSRDVSTTHAASLRRNAFDMEDSIGNRVGAHRAHDRSRRDSALRHPGSDDEPSDNQYGTRSPFVERAWSRFTLICRVA